MKRQAIDKGEFLSGICKEFLLIYKEKSDKPTEKKRANSYPACGSINWCNTLENSWAGSSGAEHPHALGHLSTRTAYVCSHEDTCSDFLSRTAHNSRSLRAVQMCADGRMDESTVT